MSSRFLAAAAALALVAGACGDGYYACDPTIDPTCYDPYYDPWGYCDAYGCYGLSARTSATALVRADGSGAADTATSGAVSRDLGVALAAARAVRRLGPASGSGTFPAVDLGPDSAPGLAAATYRLTVAPGTDGVRWQLEAKAIGAPDDQFRTVFSGATQPGASARASTGTFGVDLDALAASSPPALGGGKVLGSFEDGEKAEATSFRLESFRPGGGAAAVPDAVLTATVPARQPGASQPVAGQVTTAAVEQAKASIVPDPPTSMPGSGS